MKFVGKSIAKTEKHGGNHNHSRFFFFVPGIESKDCRGSQGPIDRRMGHFINAGQRREVQAIPGLSREYENYSHD
jgi:hypothetical protein